jgi:hypothetical protein
MAVPPPAAPGAREEGGGAVEPPEEDEVTQKDESTKRAFRLQADGYSFSVRSKVRLVYDRPGTHRPLAEAVSGDDFSFGTGRWMGKLRVIDRQNDRYSERVVDPGTGEVVHLVDHRLSEHRDRGSAKKTTKPPKP